MATASPAAVVHLPPRSRRNERDDWVVHTVSFYHDQKCVALSRIEMINHHESSLISTVVQISRVLDDDYSGIFHNQLLSSNIITLQMRTDIIISKTIVTFLISSRCMRPCFPFVPLTFPETNAESPRCSFLCIRDFSIVLCFVLGTVTPSRFPVGEPLYPIWLDVAQMRERTLVQQPDSQYCMRSHGSCACMIYAH